MKQLVILVPNGENNLSSIVGSFKLFSRANSYWKAEKGKELFAIHLAGLSSRVEFYNGLFTANPTTNISDIRKANLIIIPSLNHNYFESVRKNDRIIRWLQKQHNGGAEIASICTGAFLLASCGVLNGKECSTHWAASATFKETFPEINLQAGKIITDNEGIYTNGGAYSFLNLLIYLIEKYYDRETALYCAKVFQIDISRNNQSEFTIFNGRKGHGDETILKAQGYIEKNYRKKISIEVLSSMLNVGRRNFDRRFIKATNLTPIDYLQRVKVEAAKRILEQTGKSINDVMNEIGYQDSKAFREAFKKIVGLSPVEYKGKFKRYIDG